MVAEGVGFEPTDGVTVCGFQDRCLRPLGHPSGEATRRRLRVDRAGSAVTMYHESH